MMLMVVEHFPKDGSMNMTMEQAYNWGGRRVNGVQ